MDPRMLEMKVEEIPNMEDMSMSSDTIKDIVQQMVAVASHDMDLVIDNYPFKPNPDGCPRASNGNKSNSPYIIYTSYDHCIFIMDISYQFRQQGTSAHIKEFVNMNTPRSRARISKTLSNPFPLISSGRLGVQPKDMVMSLQQEKGAIPS
eukprot:Gb_10229 [translate_table: standard]